MVGIAWVDGGLVLLMASATAGVVLLSARAGLDTHRDTIEVLHMLGSTDLQVARLFQRRIAIDSLLGGGVGGALAALVMLVLLGTGGGWVADLAGGPLLHGRNLLLLAILPVAVAVMATVVARIAVLSTLRASL